MNDDWMKALTPADDSAAAPADTRSSPAAPPKTPAKPAVKKATAPARRNKKKKGWRAWQRFLVFTLLFINVLIIGLLVLILLGRVVIF